MSDPGYRLSAECPEYGASIIVRVNKANNSRFVGCTAWPQCKWAVDYDMAVQSAVAQVVSDVGKVFDIFRKTVNASETWDEFRRNINKIAEEMAVQKIVD